MASVQIEIKGDDVLRSIRATMNQAMYFQLGCILGLKPDLAADWLVAKVAQFRGISDEDAKAFIEKSDRSF